MIVDPRPVVANLRRLDDSLASVDRRRAELLQRRNAVAADLIEQVVVPFYEVWLVTNPPCPTCHNMIGPDGLAYIHVGPHEIAPCLDCTETPGVQSFDKWVAGLVVLNSPRRSAIVQAVVDHAQPESSVSEDIRSFCEYLLTSPLHQIGGVQ